MTEIGHFERYVLEHNTEVLFALKTVIERLHKIIDLLQPEIKDKEIPRPTDNTWTNPDNSTDSTKPQKYYIKDFKILDTRKTCACKPWNDNIWQVLNIEAVAASRAEKYKGEQITHCPWCGKELTKLISAEG